MKLIHPSSFPSYFIHDSVESLLKRITDNKQTRLTIYRRFYEGAFATALGIIIDTDYEIIRVIRREWGPL